MPTIDPNTFREHFAGVTAALRHAARDLKLSGVTVVIKRDKHGVSVETRHPARCPCGECK